MLLVQQLKSDQVSAMKAKQKETLSTLRLLISELEKEKVVLKLENVMDLSDEQVQHVINRQIKKLDKEIEAYLEVGRDVVNQELEKTLLQSYLPKQLSHEEIIVMVTQVVLQSANIGEAMKALKPALQGKADMKFVSEAVKIAFKNK